MKLIRTIGAGILLGIGLPITILTTADLLNPRTLPPERQASFATLLFLGLPPTAVGGWLVVQGRRRNQQAERDRLQATFYHLLHEGKGHINVLKFSMATHLSGAEAKAFLDERAREFNASYNVTEEGKISYYFDGDFGPTPALKADSETYDVILEFFPRTNRREVVRVIHDLLDLEWQEAKALLKQGRSQSIPLAQGVTKETAEQFRQQLESVGARVVIVLR